MTSAIDWSEYQGREIEFVKDVLGFSLTPDQERATRHIWQNPETNIPSCHGAGKTFLCAVNVFCAVFVWDMQVVTTAPTARQVKLLLWKEINAIYSGCVRRGVELGGTIYKIPRMDKGSRAAAAVGYTGSDDNAFQGVHHPKGVLIIIDEACGIGGDIDEAAQACTTDASKDRIVRVGNPVKKGTAFEKACDQTSTPISAWTQPNIQPYYDRHPDGIHRLKPEYADPAKLRSLKPIIAGGITPQWIERMRVRYMENSLFWKTRIEGVFPTENTDQLVTGAMCQLSRSDGSAMLAKMKERGIEMSRCRRFVGMDPGDGGDATAIVEILEYEHGGKSDRPPGSLEYWIQAASEVEGLHDGLETARLLDLLQIRMSGMVRGAIDRTGIGTGLYKDSLLEGLDVSGVYVGGRARDSGAFLNLRAEGFWQIRILMAQGLLHVPPWVSDRLDEELCAIAYLESEASHKIQMELKAKTKQKLKRSPNLADALMLAIVRAMEVEEG